jgi:hypothetical protein
MDHPFLRNKNPVTLPGETLIMRKRNIQIFLFTVIFALPGGMVFSGTELSFNPEDQSIGFLYSGKQVAQLNGRLPGLVFLNEDETVTGIKDFDFKGLQSADKIHFRTVLPGNLELRQTIEKNPSPGQDSIFLSTIFLKANQRVKFILTQPFSLLSKEEPVYLCPGHIYRSNNARIAQGKFPQLVVGGSVGVPESSVFHFRADRSSHSAIMGLFDDHLFGVCLPEGTQLKDNFFYHGLGLDTSSDVGQVLMKSIGYQNYPARYNGNCSPRIAPRWEEEPDYGWIVLEKGQQLIVESLIYLDKAEDRFAWEKANRVFYDFLSEELTPRTSPEHCARLITRALVEDAVVEESGLFRVTDRTDECDIGWTGGMMVAYPLLLAGEKLKNEQARQTAIHAMDQLVNKGFNKKSGLFYDSWRNGEWTVDGWWQMWAGGYHLAYTNGQSVSNILQAYKRLSPEEKQSRQIWLERCRSVVDQAIKHQESSGEFPASYSPEDGRPGEIVGFGGCWFLPASLAAYEQFGDVKYLEAAKKAEDFYFEWMATLEVWGTPIDAEGAVELEGNLPLILGERMLFDLTGDKKYLKNLEHAVNYDLSWKWAYNTYLKNPPLSELGWQSQGGNGASTCNIHLHPMSNLVLDQVWFLYEKTKDPYYYNRYRDSLIFGLGCVNLEDEDFGFGKAGWGSEQFFHTDAIQGQGPPDGGIWTRYLPWSMSSVLYGIVTAPEEFYEELGAR